LGETLSNGSSTAFSHGLGCEPTNEFSTSSVSPPGGREEVRGHRLPPKVTTWPAVACTAASVLGVSPETPR
jgi:hypothetical protein